MSLVDALRDRERLPERLRHTALRARHRLRHRWAPHPAPVAVWVAGCQRSGTQLVTQALERSPACWAHNHLVQDPLYGFRHDPAFPPRRNGSRACLLEDEPLDALIHADGAPVVAFHAVADSQRIAHLLQRFEASRVVWVWRRPADVAASAVVRWGAHQADLIGRLKAGEFERLDWRGQHLPPDLIEEVLACWRPDLTPEEGGALFWAMRNRLWETQGLASHPRARLLSYESLVADPRRVAAATFAWLEIDYDDAMVAHVHPKSVGKGGTPTWSPAIRALVEPLAERLRAQTP